MKFLIETLSGRKGVKNFTDLNEYIEYMTQYGHQIKTIVESDVPYNDKPVDLPKVSSTSGWEQLDKKAFGDVLGKAEKGDSVMKGDGKESIVKDDAKFSSTKSSEKMDKQETPKIEKSPVKNEGNSDKGFKEFKYEDSKENTDESKSEEPKEDEKSEKKEDKEEINEGIKDYLPRAGFIRNDDEDKSSQKMGVWGGQGTDDQLRKAKIIAKVKFANGDRMGQVRKSDLDNFDEYYAQYKEIYGVDDLEEGVMDGVKNFANNVGTSIKRATGIALPEDKVDEYVQEYFIYMYMVINKMIMPDNKTFQEIAQKLISTDKKMKNIHDRVMSILTDKYYMKGFPSDVIEGMMGRMLSRFGVDESILNQAHQKFVEEELGSNNSESQPSQQPIEDDKQGKLFDSKKPSMDDVEYEDDLTDADKEMYDSEIQHILEIWDTLTPEEQSELKRLLFSKSEKEPLNEEDEDFEQYETCSWCDEKFPKGSMKKEKDMGYICHQCGKGIESREGDLDWEELDEGTHYESAVNPWGQYQFIISNEEKGSELAIKAQEIYRDMEDGAIDEATAKQRLGNIAALVQNKLWGK